MPQTQKDLTVSPKQNKVRFNTGPGLKPKASKLDHSALTFRFQSKAVEVIFDGHIPGNVLIDTYTKLKFGVYKMFVKWHTDKKPHTHVGLVLREKPKLTVTQLYNYFKVGEVEPKNVAPLGKGNTAPLKKLIRYCSYLVDGHDNGRFKDTWNYKFDFELEQCTNQISKTLLLMSRGQDWDSIFMSEDWNGRAALALSKKPILAAWREYKRIMVKPKPKKLRDWQEETIKILSKQDDRKVMWIVDKKGNNGKTLLCKELALHHRAAVFGNAKTKDIARAYDGQDIVAVNLTRTQTKRVNYEAFEALKDGLMFSGKYEPETKVFDSPRVIVMSNDKPNFWAMSRDRWDVYYLDNGLLTPYVITNDDMYNPYLE